ncbi:hypothetical protein [Bradyrhizobium sp. STM 3557]|uniref:hypothetical protein n=1 Tax=Bradyrhizobium sp. STM 3557 TaxID=578920 RepID=UPI00388F5264
MHTTDRKKVKAIAQPGAPALEKGLDLLEALAAEARGRRLTEKRSSQTIGRLVLSLSDWLNVAQTPN